MLFAVISKRPRGMRTTVLNALDRARSESVSRSAPVAALVIDASAGSDFAANAQALRFLSQEFDAAIYHMRESDGKTLAEKELGTNAAAKVFQGKYGGARNLALLAAVTLGEDCVFFDDDCIPLEQCVSLYQKFFAEGKKIVAGAYAGKNTGVDSLLEKIQRALLAFRDGVISREFAAARVEEAMRGISDEIETTGAGYRGGNLGVSVAAARVACFAPTRFRMEDALYCKTAKFFLGDGALFEPAASAVPTVFHKPQAGALSALRENWVDAVRGASVALSINFLLEKSLEPTQENIERACSEAPAALLAEFGDVRAAARREAQREFGELVRKLERSEIEGEYERIANVTRAEVELPASELKREVAAFFEARSAWLEIVKRASEPSFAEKINGFRI